MNTATNSTGPGQRATTKQTYLDMLDTLDMADNFALAIQLVTEPDANWKVIETLATAARQQNDVLRAFLEAGVNSAGGRL